MLYGHVGDKMKALSFFFVFISLFTINSKVLGENQNHIKWVEQRERRKSLTIITTYNLIQTNSIKNKCIQGKRLNDLYAISFWSFIAHDSRLEENWEEAKIMLDKVDENTRNIVLNDTDERLMLQGAYEAGLLLAMRKICPDVW
jgi:hypothetical protein